MRSHTINIFHPKIITQPHRIRIITSSCARALRLCCMLLPQVFVVVDTWACRIKCCTSAGLLSPQGRICSDFDGSETSSRKSKSQPLSA